MSVCEWPVSPDCDRRKPTLTRHGQPICVTCNEYLDRNAVQVRRRRWEIGMNRPLPSTDGGA